MQHTEQAEQSRVLDAIMPNSLDIHAFADWDGMIEVGRCVVIDDQGSVERIDEDDDERHWHGEPFWAVYLHQDAGGVACVADFGTEEAADAFAAGLIVSREWRRATQS